MKIVFAGTPEFGLPCLKALAEQHEIIGVYTQPDKPAGRGRQLQASAIKQWAISQNIPVFQPPTFKNEHAILELKQLNPDVMVVIAYGLILPQSVLNIPKFGCINVHGSLLPKWRGASPIQHAILHGDETTGITIMQMDAGMDTGPMICKKEVLITPEQTSHELHQILSALAIDPLLSTLESLEAGTNQLEHQNDVDASYAPKIKKEDARIQWQTSAKLISQQIRAFNPWPICFTYINQELLKIYEATFDNQSNTVPPGTVLDIQRNGISVATGSGTIVLTKIQFAGGKVINVSDWYNANSKLLTRGTMLV